MNFFKHPCCLQHLQETLIFRKIYIRKSIENSILRDQRREGINHFWVFRISSTSTYGRKIESKWLERLNMFSSQSS